LRKAEVSLAINVAATADHEAVGSCSAGIVLNHSIC